MCKSLRSLRSCQSLDTVESYNITRDHIFLGGQDKTTKNDVEEKFLKNIKLLRIYKNQFIVVNFYSPEEPVIVTKQAESAY